MLLSIYQKFGIGEARSHPPISTPIFHSSRRQNRRYSNSSGKVHIYSRFYHFGLRSEPWLPIILERAFLKTGRIVDVHKGTIMLKMNDQQIEFNINDNIKYPAVVEDRSAIYKLTENPVVDRRK